MQQPTDQSVGQKDRCSQAISRYCPYSWAALIPWAYLDIALVAA